MGLLQSIAGAAKKLITPVTFVASTVNAIEKTIEQKNASTNNTFKENVTNLSNNLKQVNKDVGNSLATQAATAATIWVGSKSLPKASPIVKTVITAAAVPIAVVATEVINKSKPLDTAVKEQQFTSASIDLAENFSVSNAKQFVSDYPVGTAIVGGAIVGGLLIGGRSILTTLLNTAAVKENTGATEKAIDTMQTGGGGGSKTTDTPPATKDLPKDNPKDKPSTTNDLPKDKPSTTNDLPTDKTGSSAVPITPETQVIGKSASQLTSSKQHKYTHRPPISMQSMRVNIFNQSKVLNKRGY
jgi:hypothetical protein